MLALELDLAKLRQKELHAVDEIRTPRQRNVKRRGRSARRKIERSVQPAIYQRRRVPAYNLLSDSQLLAIENQADWLLQKIGVEFRGDTEALAIFDAAGADVDGERVRFEPGLVRQLCVSAPMQFRLHARNPLKTVTLGGDHIVLMPGYGSPFVTDIERGRRYATLEDFQNFVKLSYTTPYLHHSGGTICEPTDIPVNKRHLDMVFCHLKFSDKPFMGSVTSVDRAHDSIEMARLVFGSKFMATNAVMQANINVNSPLVYDVTMSGALRTYAQANQCVCVSPAIFGGAMGPVTPAAMAAQTLAEGLVGIALVQLVRPGCPVVLGSFHSAMNLRTGSLTFGTPEANLVAMALTQLGRRLGVPVRSGGGQVTSSNVADAQALQDSANAMWATLLTGANQVWHAAGWLEGGLTMSYEKFILDLDNCGATLKMLQGMDVDAESFSQASYFEAGPGENFLSTSHTMANFANANYQSLLPDPGAYESWLENGALTAAERAAPVWKEWLNSYQAPELGSSIETSLKAFINGRKAEMKDEWY